MEKKQKWEKPTFIKIVKGYDIATANAAGGKAEYSNYYLVISAQCYKKQSITSVVSVAGSGMTSTSALAVCS